MKDLHIVIVSWNTQELVKKCIQSLPGACGDLKWECVVVDNGSDDGTVAMVRDKFLSDERVDLIVNDFNAGFAYACNQGAGQHQAR